MPFGIVCSPLLLEGILRFHLRNIGTPVAKRIADSIYADNVTIGAESEEEAYDTYKEARAIFQKASMNLREWISNSQEFLDRLCEDQRLTKTIVKLFGLTWNHVEDCLWISDVSNNYQDIVIAKREVLRYFAKVYDPLGFIVPITFHGKVFLKSLWKHNLTWDEQLPETLCQEFYKLLMLLQLSKYPNLLEHLIIIQCFKCWCL